MHESSLTELTESKKNPQVFIAEEVIRLDFLIDVHLQENRWDLVSLRPSDSVLKHKERQYSSGDHSLGTSGVFLGSFPGDLALCYSVRVYRGNLWFACVIQSRNTSAGFISQRSPDARHRMRYRRPYKHTSVYFPSLSFFVYLEFLT